jgi:hypothetical protein
VCKQTVKNVVAMRNVDGTPKVLQHTTCVKVAVLRKVFYK